MKGIIFDCDGVLFDTAKANAVYYNELRKAIGLPELTKEQENFCYSATVQESLEHCTPKEKLSDITHVAQTTPYLTTALPYITLDDELPQLLEKVQASGKKIGIFTNRTRVGVIEILQSFGIDHYFVNIVTCDTVTPKPSPEGLYVIEKEWGIPLEELVFVGDSMADYGAAKQTKVTLVAFRNESIPTPLHVTGFKEIESIMGV